MVPAPAIHPQRRAEGLTIRGGRSGLGAGAALLFAALGAGLIAAAGIPPTSSVPGGGNETPPIASGGPFVAGVAGASGGTAASVAGRVAVSPIVIRLELVPRKPAAKGPLEVRAVVHNLGPVRIPRIGVTIRVSPATLVRKPSAPTIVRNLGGGRSAVATWSLCSPTTATYELVAVASIDAVEVRSRPLSVTLPGGRC